MISENFSLKGLNTFGIDVKARWYREISNIQELKELLNHPAYRSAPKLILGGGSNILFTGDYDGLVIHNKIEGIEVISEDESFAMVKADGGVNWHSFVLHAIQKNFPGIENLSLIPGYVGAAPIQNIGAYGVEIKNTFWSLTAVDLSDGSVRNFSNADCRFGYRDSIFKREAKNKYLIADVTFRLDKNAGINSSYGAINDELKRMNVSDPGIRDISDAVISIRRSKLPDPAVIGNAGSFFKNPEVPQPVFENLKSEWPGIPGYPASEGHMKIAAGWLIENSGWKGKRVGNTGMHEKQALVLVNYGNATGEELLTHARRVQQSVREKFGVGLEMEVNII